MTGESKQAVYSSSDVATLLQIKESTLRKYCLLLMDEGYEFMSNGLGHRAYTDTDLITLRKLIELKNEASMTLKQATQAVMAWKKGNSVSDSVIDTDSYNPLLAEFSLFREQQENFNKELLKQLQKQQDYIDNRLEQRDQVLMQSLKESLEARKEIAAARQKKWWQFWK